MVEGRSEIEPESLRRLLAADGLADDFTASLRDSPLLRERFAMTAQTGLLLLRNRFGRSGNRRSGNHWSHGRLYDRIRQLAPDFLLLRQAERDAGQSACDLATAQAFTELLTSLPIRQRRLSEASPFADSLLASQSGAAGIAAGPEEALERLQADLLRV